MSVVAFDRSSNVGGFGVDISRGQRNGRVSSEWFRRADDERFLSLSELYDYVHGRSVGADVRTVHTENIRVLASREDTEALTLQIGPDLQPLRPTAWAFDQLCSIAGAPAGYLRGLPGYLAGVNLQHGLLDDARGTAVKTMTDAQGRTQLRAVTGENYGRIYDHELVTAIRRIAGDGTGDTRWKVPGLLDWSTMRHNPNVDITKDTTTLYASDRDVFVFLCDDTNPIEAGKLPSGEPDLYFRGFYAWNSEVGAKTLGIATMYLRAVCQNRNLWGVQDFKEITIRHSKFASHRFTREAAPALTRFAESSTGSFVNAIKAARETIVAKDAEERTEFLTRRKFSKAQAAQIIQAVVDEEGHPPASVYDFVQGITAKARTLNHQDERLAMERTAQALMMKAA